ncbi:condensation domain-containing protein, partial [Ruminococcus flavefaciens]|uniref:condensation domain-containing protein n=1 Tax=Ruminococcus flavefaciens TaxID=1265 RepID=UPI00055D7725
MATVNSRIENVYGLSPLQEGMLFHHLYDNNSESYILQSVFSSDKKINIDLMKKAADLLSKKYDVLRTAFAYEKLKKPRQVIISDKKVEFNCVDFTQYNSFELDNQIKDYISKDLKRGFDLTHDSLFRLTFFKVDEDKYKILFSFHHIIVDGWCINAIYKKLLEYYKSLEKGISFEDIEREISEEKKLKSEYGDYISWLENQDQTKALEYWENELEGYDSEADIKAMSAPEPTEDQMREVEGETDADTTEKIRKITENNEATINVAAEIAVGILLQKYSGSKDVVFGKVVSGRNAPINGIEDMVGLFVNTIPVRIRIDEKTTVSELIKTQQEKGTESTNYDYCSLADIQSKTAQGSELIKVLYVFENYASGAVTAAEDTDSTIKVESAREQTNYGITIYGLEKEGRMSFKVRYDPNKYCDNEIRLIMDRLLKICREMAENPNG